MAKWRGSILGDLTPYQENMYSEMNDFDWYQQKAISTVIFDKSVALTYLSLGLAGEAGEVASKLAKNVRDNTPIDTDAIAKELGDVLWFVAVLADHIGYNLSQIAKMNADKLKSRQERGVLSGSGDSR